MGWIPDDLTVLDAVALTWFLCVWAGYTLVQDRLLKGPIGVNQHLKILRREWMRKMIDRDNRIVDSQLIGHTIHSVTFFASTTMLIIAGMVGAIGAAERVHSVATDLSFAVVVSRPFFELKLFLLLGIFVYAFFNFTWSLRQFNYHCAMIGSVPNPPVAEPGRGRVADLMATTLTLAVTSFNKGLRSYYFALAALTWFANPWLLLITPNLVVLVLVRRQLWSHTSEAIRAQVDLLTLSSAAESPPNPGPSPQSVLR